MQWVTKFLCRNILPVFQVDAVEKYGTLDMGLEFYTEVQDLDYLLDYLGDAPGTRKYQKLNKAMAEVVSDYSLVSFIPISVESHSTLLNAMKVSFGLIPFKKKCLCSFVVLHPAPWAKCCTRSTELNTTPWAYTTINTQYTTCTLSSAHLNNSCHSYSSSPHIALSTTHPCCY